MSSTPALAPVGQKSSRIAAVLSVLVTLTAEVMDRATGVLIAYLALGPALLIAQSRQADPPASVPAELRSGTPQLVRRCHTVTLTIKSTTLATAILRNDLGERGEFQSAGLVLTDQDPADVELTVSLPKLSAFAGRYDAEVRGVRTVDGVTATQQLIGFGSYGEWSLPKRSMFFMSFARQSARSGTCIV